METFRLISAPLDLTRMALGKGGGRALEFINLYRWVLALLLITLHVSGHGSDLLGATKPKLFFATCLAYLGVALFNSAAPMLGWCRHRGHVCPMALVDIIVITALVYASPGVTSGLGMLMVLPLVGAASLLPPRMAGLIAALATLALLTEEIYRTLSTADFTPAFTQAGILGVLFFITTIAGSLLSRRAQESEALAERREVDLASLAQLNDRIIQRMQTGVLVIDPAGHVRTINSAALGLLGRGPVLPGTHLATISKPLAEAWTRWQQAPFVAPRPIRSRDSDTPVIPRFSRLDGDPHASTLVMVDDERNMGERAQHLKLAALGQLTASIAHEIRNPLGAISHASQLLDESTQLGDADRRLLDIIRRHSSRINRIIENVLRLSRRDSTDLEPLHLAPWLAARVQDFLGTHPGQTLKLRLDEVSPDITAWTDRNQLHQVLVNLWENAMTHARTSGLPVEVRMRAGMGDAQHVTLDVIDNGAGIEPDVLEHLFEPFFTTARRGTGLGLYIARELCEGCNGTLSYLREPDGSSGFFRLGFAYAGPPGSAAHRPDEAEVAAHTTQTATAEATTGQRG